MNYILIEAKLKCKGCGKVFRAKGLRGYCSDKCRTPEKGKLIDCTCTKCGQGFQMTRPLKKQCPQCREAKQQIDARFVEFLRESRELPIDKERIVEAIFWTMPEEEITAESISDAMTLLKPKEEVVLRRRFCAPKETLKNIGLSLGIQQERVRQIEAKALRKMKHPARLNILKGLKKLADYTEMMETYDFDELFKS